MARNFASLGLAQLYEKQGYIDDALDMYKAIDAGQSPDAGHIIDAISRLEAQKKTPKEPGLFASGPVQVLDKEARMAHMLEIWLKLIFMQKRVDVFKNIKARL